MPAGVGPWGIALNPNPQLCVANECLGCPSTANVSVIDEITLATGTVQVGYPDGGLEIPIAVNKTTNKTYVANTCGTSLYCGTPGTVTVIDGATLATITVQVGYRPEAIARSTKSRTPSLS